MAELVYCSGLENLAGKLPETAETQHFCGSQDAQDALFPTRSASRDGTEVGTVKPLYMLAIEGQELRKYDFERAMAESYAERDARFPGKVYFVQAETGGPVKIGFTTNLPLRLQHMQTGSPTQLKVLLAVDAGRGTEGHYHSEFREHRVRGEWYNPASPILAEIARLKGDM